MVLATSYCFHTCVSLAIMGSFEYWLEAYKMNERTGESAWNPIVWPFKFFFTFGFIHVADIS